MIGVLKYQELNDCLKQNGASEVKKFDWNVPAKKCIDVYEKTIKSDKNG